MQYSSFEVPTTSPSSSGSSETGAPIDAAERIETPLHRAKWGDRGVTVGHFYDPLESASVASSSVRSADALGPDWLSRGRQSVGGGAGRADSGVESVM